VDYTPSPPQSMSPDLPSSISSNSNKAYAFVALPGNAQKKRPRRRYDEIERLYRCVYPDCQKAYGTLNHLNAHIHTQKHGKKRLPVGMCCYLFFLPQSSLTGGSKNRVQTASQAMEEGEEGPGIVLHRSANSTTWIVGFEPLRYWQ